MMKAAMIAVLAMLSCVNGQFHPGNMNVLIPNTSFVPVRRGRVVGRGLSVGQDYTVGFTVRFAGPVNGWSNIIRLGTGGNCCGYGQRIPAIFVYSNTMRLHQTDGHLAAGNSICGQDNNILQANTDYDMRFEYRGHRTTVYKNNVVTSTCTRQGRRAFDGLTAYAGDPWHNQPNAQIKGFYVINNVLNEATKPQSTFIGSTAVPVQPYFIGTLNVPSLTHTFTFSFTGSSSSPSSNAIIWSVTDVSDLSNYVRGATAQPVTAAYYNSQASQITIKLNNSDLPQNCAISAAPGTPANVTIQFFPGQYSILNNGNTVCANDMDLGFSLGDSLEVYLGQEQQVTSGGPPSTYAQGTISNFVFTAIATSTATRNAAVDSAISYFQLTVPDLVANVSTLMGNVTTLATNANSMSTTVQTSITNLQAQVGTGNVDTRITSQVQTLSTNVNNAQQSFSNNVGAQISTQVSSMRASLASAITTAANNLPSPTTGGSTSSTPNIGVGSSGAFEVDAGNNAMSLKTTCGAIDPCDVARAIAALKNL